MKKSDMAQVFAKELENLKRFMAGTHNQDVKWNFAARIHGAAGLAERLGIIDGGQRRYIDEEATAAAMGEREDPLDGIC